MVWRHMADSRILIRDCANFTGLSGAFIRISLKNEAKNRRATDLLVQLYQDHANPGTGHAC
jgi:threonine-phosphate decarboxylase